MTGIYKITNKLNGKCYIGQAEDLELRKDQHREALEKSDKSWYPEARAESNSIHDFSFEILQQCHKSELDVLEEYWINKFDSYENGYNRTKDGQFKTENKKFVFIDKTTCEVEYESLNGSYKQFMLNAYRKLTDTGFGLYLYFVTQEPHTFNQKEINPEGPKYPIKFSTGDVKKEINKNPTSIKNAFDKLIEVGYLYKIKHNTYQFIDHLHEDLIELKENGILMGYEFIEELKRERRKKIKKYKLITFKKSLIKKYEIPFFNKETLLLQESFTKQIDSFVQKKPEQASGKGIHYHVCLFKMISNNEHKQKIQCREWRNLNPINFPKNWKEPKCTEDYCDFCPMMCYIALDDEGKLMYTIRTFPKDLRQTFDSK